ncbi:hypothetical protein HII36_32870 [Nonomuraea sp. NN258]|uniref:hypothetical protein n=1 Tax=Nonomuraea antri TaxID=2730852 RepID=UPI00156871D1|nr:hypothetical protein [Nonomuraea antri]NRQ36592.1 hypothetical protein [Nonomuraea antri]
MRWWQAALSVTVAASISAAGPATAAQARIDPVTALERSLVDGRGVRFFGVSGPEHVFRQRGVAEFRAGRVAAVDRIDADEPEKRDLIFPDRMYKTGHLPAAAFPPGKSWEIWKKHTDLGLACGQIRLGDPATMKAVLATTASKRPAGRYDGTRTTLYQGTISMGALYRVYPRLRISLFYKPTGKYAKYAKLPVSWRLWIGEDQLVRRCWSSHREPVIEPGLGVDETFPAVDDLRLSDWGIEPNIEPPPADEVATIGELNLDALD